jgi:hypothetical protein
MSYYLRDESGSLWGPLDTAMLAERGKQGHLSPTTVLYTESGTVAAEAGTLPELAALWSPSGARKRSAPAAALTLFVGMMGMITVFSSVLLFFLGLYILNTIQGCQSSRPTVPAVPSSVPAVAPSKKP